MAAQEYACAIVVSIKKSRTTVEGFERHIKSVLPANVIRTYLLSKGKGRKVSGRIILQPSVNDPQRVRDFAFLLRTSMLNDHPVTAQVDPASFDPTQQRGQRGATTTNRTKTFADTTEEEDSSVLHWKNSKTVASKFFDWLHQGDFTGVQDAASVDLTSVDREKVHQLFELFQTQHPTLDTTGISNREKKQRRRLESLVMSVLKRQKLCKTKRYNDDVVVCSFARTDKTFAPLEERKTARDILRQQREILVSDKGGILVETDPTTDPNNVPALPVNQLVRVWFPIETIGSLPSPIKLTKIHLGGTHKKDFQLTTRLPSKIPGELALSFKAKAMGVYRTSVLMAFLNEQTGEQFEILRYVWLRAGDSDLHDLLQPTSPYVKKKRTFEKPVDENKVLHPPKQASTASGYKDLKPFKVPMGVREMVESREIEASLVPPDSDTPDEDLAKLYSPFWQNLIWLSELQAYEDIKLFDMENVTLQRTGRLFKLYVSGLAEGRPSVLRGDLVLCNWKGKQYRGRVFAVELLDVLMEFHNSFHQSFNVSVDRVDLIRFTFSRTAFRTSHAGCLAAPKTMGPSMLVPQPRHVAHLKNSQHQRSQRLLPKQFAWASQSLNDEQRNAVKQIAQGTLRPMPYVIFGPPGTGKTTTITETVYQLARLHTHSAVGQKKLKILLVAPSNDATDILVEKLSPYFPPSEMMRVLAYTRSINQCPPLVQPYVREHLEGSELLAEMKSVQIVVSTVNLAARFWCSGGGLQKGWFDCMCIDEAGHATEPEVIGAIATLMEFSGKDVGQVVLAGDPNQLGPIITSDLCKKFGLGMSYMERLVTTSPAYSLGGNDDAYPPELVTLLVRNYRSHPAILKLPNEMFYHNKLIPSGDRLTTHSMSKWEHLPNLDAGFPIVFHAVDGENQREGNSPSWFNPQEAILAVETASLLVKLSRPPIRQDEIGIITPYARQVQKIRLLLKAKDMGDIKVGSVETFQGQERRCIIISTVRSENDLLAHDIKYNLGFVANEKRFNVAVTRAKALLFVIGNPRVLQTDKKNWLPLLRYCRDNGSWMGQEWDEDADDEEYDDDALAKMVKKMTLLGDDGGETATGDNDALEKMMKTMTLAAAGKDKGDEEASEDGWEIVTDQEACGFINREE